MLGCSFVGAPDTIRKSLGRFIEETGADELMVAGAIFDQAARLRSYELLAGIDLEVESATSCIAT